LTVQGGWNSLASFICKERKPCPRRSFVVFCRV
jgi:hypothetical protein